MDLHFQALEAHHQLRQALSPRVRGMPIFALKAMAKALPHLAEELIDQIKEAQRPTLDKQLDAADAQVVGALHASGHLVTHPAVANTLQRPTLPFITRLLGWVSPCDRSISSKGWDGKVLVNPNKRGQLAFCRMLNDPFEATTHGQVSFTPQALSRWMLLLHEVAHCEFSQWVHPFDPSPDRCSHEQRSALDGWVFSGICKNRLPRMLLNECFADVYGAMLLLELTQHVPEAERTVQKLIEARKKHRVHVEAIGQHLPHATDFALQRMWDARASWKGQDPEKLRATARRLASDGMLDILDENRQVYGKRPGYALRQQCQDFECAISDVAVEQVIALSEGVDIRPGIAERFAEHPLGAAITAMSEDLYRYYDARPDAAAQHGRSMVKNSVIPIDMRLSGAKVVMQRHEKALQALINGPYREQLAKVRALLAEPWGAPAVPPASDLGSAPLIQRGPRL